MSGMDDLAPLRSVIAKYKLSARKSFGQNFILDLNLAAKIVRAAGPVDGMDVLEVGPGPGGLTRSLVAASPRKVLAVEKDRRFFHPLRELAEAAQGKLEVEISDALSFDPAGRIAPPAMVISNLPFNQGTAMLARWISPPAWPPFWDRMALTFQKEVAKRLVAAPCTKAYGRLSVLAQWRAEVRIALEIPASAFVPEPAVDATLVLFTRRLHPLAPADEKMLFRIVAQAFSQRRKMIRSSLRPLFAKPERVIEAAGLDPKLRADSVPITEYCALARAAAELSGAD